MSEPKYPPLKAMRNPDPSAASWTREGPRGVLPLGDHPATATQPTLVSEHQRAERMLQRAVAAEADRQVLCDALADALSGEPSRIERARTVLAVVKASRALGGPDA